ncbi:hypothetical protein A3G63_03585 [Candidatus Kaiserbacteria bacterium RIFCSPLOWO2_12_FULL_52_8]|uniref:Type II secretion system protein GspG C-terminal domain-containing protein n=1 Tax=Candidatus Kaiserbacteria bacterium RIFCSPHIGHO2_01_FULL_53_31 TaxID=1798481 RepID=A0A1F6CGP1_9BACT|nr:MAG: hypothetical protein A2678_00260 [Candidatus Kaiserbacteria bacterium RIFCSPHIGHO2_01_FULL_53_31]OGG93924.1 MAG: hypothetical protein A3G63_03585 [Candidatus Kaiserbacteria bacterium RIFCSPLOWO2_12_FULL_52_8]
MHKNRSRGFTLIELLVVIAIIGILSAVVLASLGTARDRAKDVSVQTSLSGLRAAAELYAGSHSNKYQSGTTAVSACNATNTMFLDTTDGNGKGLIDAVSKTINGTAGTYTHSTLGITVVCTINAVGDAWAVSARLPSNPSTNPFFCVDSDGKAQTQSAAHATTNFACL